VLGTLHASQLGLCSLLKSVDAGGFRIGLYNRCHKNILTYDCLEQIRRALE
jgi:hypothetical protein